jgi:hypothetical protein
MEYNLVKLPFLKQSKSQELKQKYEAISQKKWIKFSVLGK